MCKTFREKLEILPGNFYLIFFFVTGIVNLINKQIQQE